MVELRKPVILSFKDDVNKLGFAFVSQYRPEIDTVAIAASLGQPLTPWTGGLVQELIPRISAPPNTYSGIYGIDRFPFHTDLAHWRLPPHYLLLRCISGYPDVPTQLLDGYTIFDAVTLDLLMRAVFIPRRPRDGELKLLCLCEETDNGYLFRWDEVFLKPASRIGGIASQRIREQLLLRDHLAIGLAKAGDTLVIDNWRMLHARSMIPAGCRDRRIHRIYMESLH